METLHLLLFNEKKFSTTDLFLRVFQPFEETFLMDVLDRSRTETRIVEVTVVPSTYATHY